MKKLFELINYINIKIILLLSVTIIIILTLFINHINEEFEKEIENKIKIELVQKVDMAYNLIKPIIERYNNKEISKNDTIKKIQNILSNMTYKDEYSLNYIFMTDYIGKYLVQPYEKNKIGKNMWNYKDVKGNYVIQELIKLAKSKEKKGFYKYYNKAPLIDEELKKLSYIRGIPEIQVYIGTGKYLDYKNNKLVYLLNFQKNLLIGFLIIIVSLVVLFSLKYQLLYKKLLIEKENERYEKIRYETLFNNSQDAIVEIDYYGTILNINNAFTKIFGFTKEEAVGKNIDNLIVVDKSILEAKYLTQKTIKMGTLNTETIRYTKDKNPINVSIKTINIVFDNKIIGGYGIYSDITQEKEYEKKLEHLSSYDLLTGLNNFNYFERIINEYKIRKTFNIGILNFDLNNLKLINDILGHHYGDMILKNFAKILKKTINENNIIARVGGDEFVAIIIEPNENEIKELIDSLNKNIEKYNQTLSNEILYLSVAIGYSIGDNDHITELFKIADEKMYKNKMLIKSKEKKELLFKIKNLINRKDFSYNRHIENLKKYSKIFGEKLKLDKKTKERLLLLVEVYDIGKITISDELLTKKEKLTDEDWKTLKSHSEKGYRIALNYREYANIAELILKHHERWDGKGYPLGLSKKEIPIECRILNILESYEAMTNKRPYQKIKTKQEAIEELIKYKGTQFDPKLIEEFLEIVNEI
ncbi:PAS domain S-box-containing protein/diguanylate cyclase (GGDEF)-like protein [Hypnocyclicus thermotrophus]|uniref:PAS domain S-box-containing protein/diguanylate cyclase (GGDEF)-like protein n=1 Tax=Hypnocyclicus thermotrophus TaxID=1627895 RepID=A0AA46E039_9FUSO|nr:HD domain-containing phosphohydrolase [Hypnocyclicus thermotrophus]TDT72320.1 PAS domain S-box-containing protein/diguanylate cyclase (GGDEF)-like protein [Hypnocyclicus thermotrophus]